EAGRRARSSTRFSGRRSASGPDGRARAAPAGGANGVRIVITGGTGNTAEYLVRELEGRHDLVLFDAIEPGQNRFPFEVRHPYVKGVLTDPADCDRAVAGCEAVVHLGGVIWDSEKEDFAQGRGLARDATMRVNAMGTYCAVDAAARAGIRTFVMAST